MYNQQSKSTAGGSQSQSRGRTLERKASGSSRTYSPPPCNCCHCSRRVCALIWCIFSLILTMVICSHFFMIVAIAEGKADSTMLDLIKETTKWDFLQGVENPTANANDTSYCYLHDHPTKIPAAIRLGFLFLNILGILLFIIAALLSGGKIRRYLAKGYMSLSYSPLLGILGVLYFKISICWQSYIYWIIVFVDLILNYGWATFGNEIAKAFNAWVDDPEEVQRRDMERSGKVAPTTESVPKAPISRPRMPPPRVQNSESGSDIDNFVQRRMPPPQQQQSQFRPTAPPLTPVPRSPR